MVHDKVHLIKYLNEAIDKIRRREVNENHVLKYGRFTLLKNEENRTEFQQQLFKQIMDSDLEVAKVHYAKETFRSLINNDNDDYQAKGSLKSWASTLHVHYSGTK
ncbi:MAG: transposase [Saprospiraceae bacterium]|nr:transposase [Saprospiraceae bacterium]